MSDPRNRLKNRAPMASPGNHRGNLDVAALLARSGLRYVGAARAPGVEGTLNTYMHAASGQFVLFLDWKDGGWDCFIAAHREPCPQFPKRDEDVKAIVAAVEARLREVA